MTSPAIVRQGEISLDGLTYRIKGQVHSFLASRFAPKISIGPDTMDAHEEVSYLRWDDWSEGIGLEEFYSTGGPAPKKAWFSDCDLTRPLCVTLGPLVTQTTSITGTFPAAAAGDDLPALAIFKSEVYALVRNTVAAVDRVRVYKYNNTTDSWDTALETFPSGSESFARNADIRVGFVGGTEYIIACAGNTYTYSSDGTAWTQSTKDIMRMTFHDDTFWGIDRAGQLFSATTLGTNTNLAVLPVPAPAATTDIAYISDLVTIPDATGADSIHAATAFGLYIYDQTNDKWLKTNITLPEARFNGRGTNLWNGDIYIPAGMGLWRAIYGTQINVLPVGPDGEHGLPDVNRGAIVDLAPGHDRLAVCLEGDFTGFRHYVADTADLRSLVMSYNGHGWQVLWQSTTSTERARKVIIGSAYNEYRLWFSTTVGTARRIYYLDLPTERFNPHQSTGRPYAASSTLLTPWFKVGSDVEGIGLSVLVETDAATTSETMVVEYARDFIETYTNLGTISGDAVYEWVLPNVDDPVGVNFFAIRFRLTFARGATTTDRVMLHSLTLKFKKFIPDRQTHVMTLDLNEDVGGRSPREQWRDLRSAIRKKELLEFTFRDDESLGSEDRFFCHIKNFRADLDTGLDYRGEVNLELTEVYHVIGGQWDVDFWDSAQWA